MLTEDSTRVDDQYLRWCIFWSEGFALKVNGVLQKRKCLQLGALDAVTERSVTCDPRVSDGS